MLEYKEDALQLLDLMDGSLPTVVRYIIFKSFFLFCASQSIIESMPYYMLSIN